QRIEGAETARMIHRPDGNPGVARLAMHEARGVVAKYEVRTEVDRQGEFAQRLALTSTQPQRTPHRPMGGRIAVVRQQALAGGFERLVDICQALFWMMQEGV